MRTEWRGIWKKCGIRYNFIRCLCGLGVRMEDAGAFLLGMCMRVWCFGMEKQELLRRKKKPILKTMTKNGKIAVFIRPFISFTGEMLVK